MAGSNTDPDRSTKQALAFAAPDGMRVGRGANATRPNRSVTREADRQPRCNGRIGAATRD